MIGEGWKFVPDEHGGHYLSVPSGDKWYPETHFRNRMNKLEELASAVKRMQWSSHYNGRNYVTLAVPTEEQSADLLRALADLDIKD